MSEAGIVRWLGNRAALLWAAALLLYGVGDTVATLWGLSTANVAEGGPIAEPALRAYGPLGLIGLKVAVFGGFLLLWRVIRSPGRIALPLALAVVGAVVTAWNLVVISTA